MDFNNKYETLDDFISSRLNDEEVGIWFYDNGLEKFIIKLPNHIIRAINQGCKLEMLVGQYFVSEKTYPVIGWRIQVINATFPLFVNFCKYT